jgi:hypothetical protein
VLALDRYLIHHLAILIDLAHADAQHLAHAQAHLQRHFEIGAIAQGVAPTKALPDEFEFCIGVIPHARHG